MTYKASRIFMNSVIWLSILVVFFGMAPASHAQRIDATPPSAPETNQYTNFLYLPFVSVPHQWDLSIAWLEINQGIQDNLNQVPLVANRPAVVRLYIYTNGSQAINNVTASLSAYRNGVLLPSSPLTAAPGIAWPSSEAVANLRKDQSKSINFYNVPTSWLSGQVTFVATVDPGNTIPEQNETNNTYQTSAQFLNVPALQIMVVPIQYTHQPTGVVYPPPSTSFVQQALFKLYPVSQVNVSVHAPYSFVGNLRQEYYWSNVAGTGILDKITSLKNSEGAPSSQVYYGLIPLVDQSGGTWWPGSGIAGIGWLGLRASVGLTKSTNPFMPGDEILPHEVGHNFGRYHSPCGSPSSVDPNYPYPSGAIGQIGFEVHTLPVGTLIPETTPDIMGYCDYAWVSDYTYQGLLEDQRSTAMMAMRPQSPQAVLYVRGRFDLQGNLNLLPMYVLDGVPDEPVSASDYILRLTNAEGEVVLDAPIRLIEAEEQGIKFTAIESLIPLPDKPFDQLLVVQGAKVLAQRAFASQMPSFGQSASLELTKGSAELRWPAENSVALVRISLDGGRTWQMLDIDVPGGTLFIDPSLANQGAILFQIILADAQNATLTFRP